MLCEKSSGFKTRKSLAIWAIIAMVLVAFSYVFTLLIAAACVYLPFLWFSTWPGLYPVIAMLSGFTISLVILWSLVPRKDAFSAPGPALTADVHPRLFNELSSIADRFNEPIPAEVYLAPEVNA